LPVDPQQRQAWRDPWVWACALLALAPLLRSWGAPLGEPASDDFDYLFRARFGPFDFFDGGGAVVHWRPLARQAYFAAVTPLLLSRPGLVAVLQAGLLVLACVLIYRTLRRQWPAPWAAAAATFPALMEPARMLVAWPSAMQDLGSLALSALALHQAARARVGTALAALAGALLCKETSVVVALLLPWMPRPVDGAPPPRRRLAIGALAVVAVWLGAYLVVVRRAGLHWLRELDPEGLAAPWPARLSWALEHAARDALGFDARPAPYGVSFAGMARSAGYKSVHEFSDLKIFEQQIGAILAEPGPVFVCLKIVSSGEQERDYSRLHGPQVRKAFRDALAAD